LPAQRHDRVEREWSSFVDRDGCGVASTIQCLFTLRTMHFFSRFDRILHYLFRTPLISFWCFRSLCVIQSVTRCRLLLLLPILPQNVVHSTAPCVLRRSVYSRRAPAGGAASDRSLTLTLSSRNSFPHGAISLIFVSARRLWMLPKSHARTPPSHAMPCHTLSSQREHRCFVLFFHSPTPCLGAVSACLPKTIEFRTPIVCAGSDS